MNKTIKTVLFLLLGALSVQSCYEIEDDYTYGNGTQGINWTAAADSSTTSLVSRFWNTQTGYFVYNNDVMDGGTTPGYWPQAHAMDVIIDAYVRTGEEKYAAMFPLWYEGIKAVNFSNPGKGYRNDFYDDSEWIALTMLSLYEVTKEQRYLDTALDLWQWIKTGWSDLGGGGIAWEAKSHLYSKNACSNGPAAILAARLYPITKDKTDLEWSKKIYEWEKSVLFNPASGAVYDNIDTRTGTVSTTVLSYNSGTFLGAAHLLYGLTADRTYLNDAQKAAYFAITNSSMIDTGNNVLRDEGTGDGGLFKGIFMRYFSRLILEPDLNADYARKFMTFFNNNASTLWLRGAYKTDLLFGPDWTKHQIGTTDLTSHTSGCTLIEAKAWLDSKNK